MRTVIVSGWAQPAADLGILMPEATVFDYAQWSDENEMVDHAAQLNPKLVIGWSLGGQLAACLIAQKAWQPEALILIGTPFQFTETVQLTVGMPHEAFQAFRKNYIEDTARTVARFNGLIAKGDREAAKIEWALSEPLEAANVARWLPWLDRLGTFSANELNFTHFPRTLILHGRNDRIVAVNQASLYHQAIPHAELQVIEEAGHALHLHDLVGLQRRIQHFTRAS